MKQLIILFTISILLSSCNNKKVKEEISFTYLPKLSGKTVTTYETINDSMVKDIYLYIETILIDNPPKDLDSALSIEKHYMHEHSKIALIDSSIDAYEMRFYRKSDCTAYFIENAQDPGGFSSRNIYEDCGMKDAEGLLCYDRDSVIKNRWIANFKKTTFGYEYHDTIYCDYKHTPPWKETPWIPKPGE